jgi:hypothetical protein
MGKTDSNTSSDVPRLASTRINAPPIMKGASAGKPRGRPRKQQPQLQAQRQTQEADCIVVAVTSETEAATSTPAVTTTKLGLLRLQEVEEDLYEPGTAPPRAYQRIIDALDSVDPEVEDTHDALLADGEADARLAREDAAALEEGDEGEEEDTTIED